MGIERDDRYKIFEAGRCKNCGGTLKETGLEIYICSKCGEEVLSDFGKVKEYIKENGPSNALDISEGTGISIKKIEKYLREGRIEIPEGSDIYITCQGCGAEIRYGRFCPVCAANLKKEFTSALTPGEIGEPPKITGKRRYTIERR